MGREHASREKKLPMVIFLIFVQKNVSTIRFQEIKIRPLKGFEKMRFLCFYIIGVFWPFPGTDFIMDKKTKCKFLKTLSWADFDLLESNSIYIFVHKNQKIYHR